MKKDIQVSIIYTSDGRHAAWHVPFPFVRPSDIGVRLIHPDGVERVLTSPAEFVAYWDFIVCVVPPGCRLKLWLRRPLADILAELAHKKAHEHNYDSELADGVYLNFTDDNGHEHLIRDEFNPVVQERRDVVSIGDTAISNRAGIRPDVHGQHNGLPCARQCIEQKYSPPVHSKHLFPVYPIPRRVGPGFWAEDFKSCRPAPFRFGDPEFDGVDG